MPITLGCPSCGKRFRARDESAGKKVKCPYCQAAVPVPSADEAASAGAPTAPLPSPDSGPIPAPPPRSAPAAPPARPAPPPPPPATAPVASPDDWGAVPTSQQPASPPPSPPPASDPLPLEPEVEPLPVMSAPPRGGKDRPKPAKAEKPAKPKGKGEAKTPEEILAAGWRSVRRGLFWVQFALLWLALIGFIGFGKAVYTRAVGELPKGDGADWVSLEGYVNASGPNSVPLSKADLLNLAAYGIPVFFAGVCIVFGRLIASSAPRSSGARGLFTLSALLALVGLPALFGAFAFESGELYKPRLLMKDEFQYTWYAFLILVPLAEFWFLSALTASGVALKRPKAARAVGMVGFVVALGAFAATLGWKLYVENGRPKKPDDDVRLYEQAALMMGWLLLVGVYWRAVRNVRVAAREYLDAVEEG